MAASTKKTTTKSTAKKAAPKPKAAKPKAKKPAAKPKAAPAAKGSRAADQPDKSIEEFRAALERSVTLSRDRVQEIVDDTVKRGKMTRKDANELISKLVSRSRKQTDELLKELESALGQARKGVGSRAKKTTKGVRTRTGKARKRVTKTAIDVADEPLAQADKLRSRAHAPGFPITAYDELTAAQIKRRISDLNKADARKVRTREKDGKGRKSILDEIEKRLAA